jgi:hypothetical protein
MVLIMSQNGKGPLDPGPETALIHQLANPLRSPVGDTRKFEAFDARKSRKAEQRGRGPEGCVENGPGGCVM